MPYSSSTSRRGHVPDGTSSIYSFSTSFTNKLVSTKTDRFIHIKYRTSDIYMFGSFLVESDLSGLELFDSSCELVHRLGVFNNTGNKRLTLNLANSGTILCKFCLPSSRTASSITANSATFNARSRLGSSSIGHLFLGKQKKIGHTKFINGIFGVTCPSEKSLNPIKLLESWGVLGTSLLWSLKGDNLFES